jgi:hypothetical protein
MSDPWADNRGTIGPPAGWLSDPSDSSLERYWDGSSWTEFRRPRAQVSPQNAGHSVLGTYRTTQPPGVGSFKGQAVSHVTPNHAVVSESKLNALKWLWRTFLLATIASGIANIADSYRDTAVNSSDALRLVYAFILTAFVALLTMTGVAASAARQIGARTSHPALAVLLVIGSTTAAAIFGGLISPEYRTDAMLTSLYNEDLDKQILYGAALLIQSLVLSVTALTPVVVLSRTLGNRYSGDEIVKEAPAVLGWRNVWLSSLAIGSYEVVTAGPVSPTTYPAGVYKGVYLFFICTLPFLWRLMDFKKHYLHDY